jgi:dUTP pyrophosphatase
MPIKILFETVDKNVKLPTYAHSTDAGMDVYANENVTIKPQETKIVPIGISVQIPAGYEIQIRPRSGISYNTPLRVANCVGTIDAGYRGEIGVILTNTSLPYEIGIYKSYLLNEKGNKHGIYEIKKYDRIAQIILNKIYKISFANELIDKSERNVNGFGSTGK